MRCAYFCTARNDLSPRGKVLIARIPRANAMTKPGLKLSYKPSLTPVFLSAQTLAEVALEDIRSNKGHRLLKNIKSISSSPFITARL